MKKSDDTILLSASDLMRFMGCVHSISLDLALLKGAELQPKEDGEDAALLQKQGDAHEAAHLARLIASGRRIVEIKRGPLAANTKETQEALKSGADVIFQGAFLSGNWGGWSDFLERVERPSDLGDFSYEVTDTKLKRKSHPKHVLQLILYSDLLTEIQGVSPEFAHIELGNGNRETLRLSDYAAYARLARARLENFIASPDPTRPIPCSDCSLCRWQDHCEAVWIAEDSLFTVANITKGQVKKIEIAGIATLEELANSSGTVRGIASPTLDKLRAQARLQQARKSGEPAFELRPSQLGKGFDLLPEPQKGDLFYDIEGDPHYEGGLEYLHGIWFDQKFKAFWGHDHEAEARALEELLDFFRSRIEQYPLARIYHYAPYEITALRRLAAKYGIGEAFLDRLLRERRFIDLFAVVRGGVLVSEPNYSIKSLEAFYGLKRSGEVKTAGGSIVAYEKWRETQDQRILDEIEEYNRIDCLSTEKLRDWLVAIRPSGIWYGLCEDKNDKEVVEAEEARGLHAKLAASQLSKDHQELLFNLGFFHKREAKPSWWAIFDSLGKDDDDLIDDFNALAGLEAIGSAFPIKRSMCRSYRFPDQETKLREGKDATIPNGDSFASLTIESFNHDENLISLKVGNAKSDLLADRLTLHPGTPLNTDGIAAAVMDVINDQCGEKRYRAVDDLLNRSIPKLKDHSGVIIKSEDLLGETIEAINKMDQTVLPIQGPPGTGKTYVTAHAILSLVKKGHRVGVASNSHEAIRNVLMACVRENEASEKPISGELVHRISNQDDGYPSDSPVRRIDNNEQAENSGHVVGGTAFFFSTDPNIQSYDWLFIDEAGQVGLANTVAMGRAARNIVLVGDPRQLPQVIQGAHPEPANLSCLEWVLGEHATVPPDRGIFLAVTRRMHPKICQFISEQVYEGRLTSHPDTELQRISKTTLPESGAYWFVVEHNGNSQRSDEEVMAIKSTIEKLVLSDWTNKYGKTRSIKKSDIIVVAPYNAQVNSLMSALPADVRVGTVDKFQGQEAPICLVSMTASTAEDSPRGMEFLYSINRINVAISRAKCLALVFGSPRLREAKCENINNMNLVNTLCALPEHHNIG